MPKKCLNCENRRLHCHSECEDYKEYEKEREMIRKKRNLESEYYSAHAESVKRIVRRRK